MTDGVSADGVAAGGGRPRVSLIDPSLFTLPYDRALAMGLAREGRDVRLHGRPLGRHDNDADGIALGADFYHVATSRAFAGLPKKLRTAVKGLEHGVGLARLARRLRAERPGVIHFQWLPLPVLDRRFLPRFAATAPVVLTVHDSDPFNGNPSAALQGRGFLDALRLFDALIVHTRQGIDRLAAQGIPADRLHLVPHGLLLPPADRAAGPDPMAGETVFLLFGAIKPYKGLDVLIEAFAAMPPDLRARSRIRVVGKPAMDLAGFRDLARARGVADRLEIDPRFVPDAEIPGLFGDGVVAVFPYREIEASGVLSIAVARARPVVASAIGNFAELVESGRQGLLVPPGDVAGFAAAMARMVADRDFAAACSRGALALARGIPDWDAIARQTIRVYAAARDARAARLGRNTGRDAAAAR